MHYHALNLTKESLDTILMFCETTLNKKINTDILKLQEELFEKKQELEYKNIEVKKDKLLKPELEDIQTSIDIFE